MEALGGGKGREAMEGLGGERLGGDLLEALGGEEGRKAVEVLVGGERLGGDLVEAFGGGRLGFWRKGREGFVGLADTFSLFVGGILEFALDDVFCL